MPGTKRKASFAFPYERPAKLTKSSTSTTVSKAGSIVKSPSVTGPKFTPLKFPSLKVKKSATTEIALSSSSSSSVSDPLTPPSLRRASTLTLEDAEDKSARLSKLSSSKKPSKSSKTPSLTKESSNVDEGALVTKLSGLRSGSIVGETTAADPVPSTSRSDSASKLSPRKSLTKKLSSKKSSAGRAVPSVPSGLTKLALTKGSSLNISTAGLVENIDETEVTEALASLKSHLSKEKSKTSVQAAENGDRSEEVSDETNAENDGEETMDEDGPSAAVDPAMPPGGFLDIAISFDTTGSMMGYLNEVKAKVQNLVQRLQADIPGIHIAIIAHGDYCDVDKYIVKWIDFGATLPEICDFVTNVDSTYGGDGPECYELVLSRAREVLSWRPGSQRVLIMIGDDVPHEPGYTYGGKTYHIDWRQECQELKNMNVKVYGVQAGENRGAENFHKEMARLTNGRHLKLGKFESCFDFLMMICYCEGNPDMLQTYEEEMRARDGRLSKDVSFCMAELAGTAPKVTKAKSVKKPKSPKTPAKPSKTAKKVEKVSPKKKTAAAVKKAGKAPVAKKTVTAKKRKVISKKKKEMKVNRVLKREKLPDANLNKGPLKHLKWSKWVCAILPTGGASTKKTKTPSKKNVAKAKAVDLSGYANCKHLPGHRLKVLFDDDTKTPSIYEIAVQCGETRTSKKHVMYYRRSKGWVRKGRWDMYLLRHRTVRAEVNKALEAGFSIWVRRGVPVGKAAQMKRLTKAYEYIRDNFDYAWKKYVWRKIDGKQTHREVKVNNKGSKKMLISHSEI